MKYPYIIATQEKQKALKHWQEQFVDNDRNIHEGIWRRTQDPKNAKYSKWKSENDKRLRVVHFLDHYDIQENGDNCDLVLIGSYLRINHSLPQIEAKKIFGRYMTAIKNKRLTYDDTITPTTKYPTTMLN